MKFLKNIVSFGPALIIGGYVYYSVQNVWNLPVQIIFYSGLVLRKLHCFFA